MSDTCRIYPEEPTNFMILKNKLPSSTDLVAEGPWVRAQKSNCFVTTVLSASEGGLWISFAFIFQSEEWE